MMWISPFGKKTLFLLKKRGVSQRKHPFLLPMNGLPTAAAAAVAAATAIVALLLAGSAALGATLGLIFKALFLVERLLAFGEQEFAVAIFACQYFVCHF
jgi:hypothetical protein